MTLTKFPDEFSSVSQRGLAVPSPPIVEKMYVIFLCKSADDMMTMMMMKWEEMCGRSRWEENTNRKI